MVVSARLQLPFADAVPFRLYQKTKSIGIRFAPLSYDPFLSSGTRPGTPATEIVPWQRRESCKMHVFRKLCAVAATAAVLAMASASLAHAQNIISVGGSDNGYDILNGAGGESYAASWSETSAYDNASISALLANQSGSDATGTAYLTTALGPSATTADLVSSQSFTIPSTAGDTGSEVALFSGLTLDANQTYYLVLNVDPQNMNLLGWVESEPPTVATAPGVTYGWDYLTGVTADDPATNVYPYNSAWSPSSLYGTPPDDHFGVNYSVQGDPVAPVVPESTSLVLILPSVFLLAGLTVFTRRRKAMHS